MRKPIGVVISALALLAATTSALLLSTPGTAYAANYDFTWPDDTGCSNTAVTIYTASIATGKVELRYSTSCRTVWSRITVFPNALIEDPEGGAHRNSDGFDSSGVVKLTSGANGSVVAFTRQLNDAGVTSYAWGQWTTSDGFHKIRTASY